jgi:gliding motility-associated-like protein
MRVFIHTFLILSPFISWTQVINSGATVVITDETVIAIDTDFINTGQLINQGEIRLWGDWQNLGIYDDSNGELLFTGNTEQFINNNAQNINDIQILGGGRKVLTDDATINGQINFQSGKLVVPEGVSLTLGQGVTIVGAGEGNFIEGMVFRTGTDDLFFPIGIGNQYLPVVLNEVSGDNPIIGMTALEGPPDQRRGGSLTDLSERYYWRMEADLNYEAGKITLPYEMEAFIEDTTQVVVAQASEENRAFQTLGRSAIVGDQNQGLVTSEGLAIGPFFAIGYVNEKPKLPPIRVINVLTPVQDGKHDFLRIENIEVYEGNIVDIFNRSGDKVFTMENYNNQERVFRGISNVNGQRELEGGTYFYTIRKGRKQIASGFIFLKY